MTHTEAINLAAELVNDVDLGHTAALRAKLTSLNPADAIAVTLVLSNTLTRAERTRLAMSLLANGG